MGLYDTVKIKCPQCLEDVEFQSKAGDCYLAEYEEYKVPVIVAQDIAGSREDCPNCGYSVQALPKFDVDYIQMRGK